MLVGLPACKTVEVHTETHIRDTIYTVQPVIVDKTLTLTQFGDSLFKAFEMKGKDTVTKVVVDTKTKVVNVYHKPDSIRITVRDTLTKVVNTTKVEVEETPFLSKVGLVAAGIVLALALLVMYRFKNKLSL